MEKSQGEYIERESAGNVSPSLNSQANTKLDLEKANLPDDTVDQEREYTGLSDEHREYLLRRHGTVHLDPLPSLDDADPYNWPNWKKLTNLFLVAFHAMMATFTAASIGSAFVNISEDLNVSLQRVSYLTGLFIAILGVAPLFWRPLCNRYGRRPVFLLSLVCSLVGNVGCANSPSYATMALCWAITAFCISPAAAIGSAVVAETFFKRDRARYMGIWTVMVTLGASVAPLIFGFVAMRVGYRWIYYILACTNAVQLILYIFFGPETLYMRNRNRNNEVPTPSGTIKQEYLQFRRIDPTPLTIWDFVQPLTMVRYPCVVIPATAYSMIFLWATIMIPVEIPQIYPEKYHFNTEQVGLQLLGTIIGALLGELIGGWSSDKWMWARQHRTGTSPPPEYRLWLSYLGHALAICGVVVFAVQIQNSGSTWTVSPLIGAAIAAAGNQIVTTVNITYSLDCYHEQAASVGVFVSFVRQTWGFIGPFWFPQLLENVGWAGGAGIAAAMMVGVSVIPTILVQWKGENWR